MSVRLGMLLRFDVHVGRKFRSQKGIFSGNNSRGMIIATAKKIEVRQELERQRAITESASEFTEQIRLGKNEERWWNMIRQPNAVGRKKKDMAFGRHFFCFNY
jgi:hypothetical protein